MNGKNQIRLTDYIYVLFKWKKFLIINMILVIGITAGLSLLLDNKYKAQATIMLPTSQYSSPLGGLLSGAGSLLTGGLFGEGNEQTDKVFGILGSRKVLEKVIDKFDLVNYYQIEKFKRDATLRALRSDVSFDLNQNGMIEISMIHKDSIVCANIVNYFVTLADSINRKMSAEEATNYRKFVEMRYRRNLTELKSAEDEFEKFQTKYGVYVIPAQMEFAINAVGNLEVQLAQKEIEAELVRSSAGSKSPAYIEALKQIELLKNKIDGLKNGDKSVDESIVFFPFKDAPEIQKEYMRLYREIQVQTKVQEFIMPIYEQAAMEEHKNMPSIIVLDKAVPPQLKDSPKRSFIVIGVGLIFFFIFVAFVFRAEEAVHRIDYRNPLEESESKFFLFLEKLYRIKV